MIKLFSRQTQKNTRKSGIKKHRLIAKIKKTIEIRFVERGICPIATLYSLAAACMGGRCKQGAIIFHGSRVVVIFVPKFLAMVTRVVRGEIQMTPSNSAGPKIGGR